MNARMILDGEFHINSDFFKETYWAFLVVKKLFWDTCHHLIEKLVIHPLHFSKIHYLISFIVNPSKFDVLFEFAGNFISDNSRNSWRLTREKIHPIAKKFFLSQISPPCCYSDHITLLKLNTFLLLFHLSQKFPQRIIFFNGQFYKK